jgi:general secretion pathway protein C
MTRWLLVLSVLLLSSRVARADDPDPPMYACKAASPDTKISVTFKPDTSIRDLAVWVMGFQCKNIIIDSAIAKHATKVTIIAPNKYTPKQAMQLFVDAIEATGLVVVQKPDSIIIKLGPNMPKTCPDIASSSTPIQTSPPVARVPDPPAVDLDAVLAASIKTIDATHYEVMSSVIDQVLLNPMAMAKGARVVPAMKNGKPDGFKVYAIRPGSLWARIGFQNGDTFTSINKLRIDSADDGLEVYTKLREMKKLDIEVLRAGKPVTLVITIK